MHIAILSVDHVLPQFYQAHGDFSDMFVALLKSEKDIQFTVFDAINGHLPGDTDVFDAYIITGSKHSVYEEHRWLRALEAWILRIYSPEIKLIGICFGHQLLAQLLGGEVEKSPLGWGIGVHSYHVVTGKKWMQPEVESFSLLVSHQDQVISLPREAELIATSDFCKNAAFIIGKSVLCFQGHPEFTASYLKALMLHRKLRYTDKQFNEGMRSLTHREDGDLIGSWLSAFIQRY